MVRESLRDAPRDLADPLRKIRSGFVRALQRTIVCRDPNDIFYCTVAFTGCFYFSRLLGFLKYRTITDCCQKNYAVRQTMLWGGALAILVLFVNYFGFVYFIFIFSHRPFF